jgi:hypothetical protein
MRHKLTENVRCCMQHNQLLTESHVELEYNSTNSAFEDVQSCGIFS